MYNHIKCTNESSKLKNSIIPPKHKKVPKIQEKCQKTTKICYDIYGDLCMNNFTFLTEDEIFGYSQLDILEKYGTKCAITDFSILLGGYVAQNYYTSEGETLKDRTGWWWTKSHDGDNDACVVSHYGDRDWDSVNSRNGGARPALPYSSISSISSNGVRGRNGILEVEYGEYPQTIVSESYARSLESAYNNGTIKQTGKSYTTDSVRYQDTETGFKARTHIEYEYNGKKYIRFVADSNCNGEILSDGRTIREGKPYWVEVEPIKWMIDERKNIALCKKLIFSGVQFNLRRNYKGDFDRTDIKQFMDKHFAKDIVSSVIKEMTPEERQQFEKEQKILEKRRNPYGLKFGQVSEERIIKGAIESGVAVFLHGPSSEGKSARVKQIDPDCVIIYLRNATPESLNGKSVYNSETGEMIDVKPSWLKKIEEKCEKEPDRFHIVFLDEITNALPSIQGIAFNIVLDREVNGIWKLPENARIVAAGNDMKDSLAANQLAEPLFNRFAHVYIKTTTESWLKWASENNIHPAIYSYIAYKKGETLRSKYDGEKPNADPRKWEMASKMLYATGEPEMLRALVGEDITREFVEFCNQQVITLDDVINGNYSDRDVQALNTAERYATTMGLSQVEEEHLDKVRGFVTGLGAEFGAIFDSLWTHGDESRLERIAEAKLASMPGGGIRR